MAGNMDAERRSELLWELAHYVTPGFFQRMKLGYFRFDLDLPEYENRVFCIDPCLPEEYNMPTYGGLPAVWTQGRVLELLKHVEARLSTHVHTLKDKIADLQAAQLEQSIPTSDTTPLAVVGQGSFSRAIR